MEGRICPYCHILIRPGEKIYCCSDCLSLHHQQCWEANKGCTTPNCQGKPLPVGEITTSNYPSFSSGTQPAYEPAYKQTDSIIYVPGTINKFDLKTYPKPPNGKRFLACLIDDAIIFASCALMFIVLYISDLLHRVEVEASVSLISSTHDFITLIIIIAVTCWIFWYGYTKDGWGEGQSIGKRACGLMVVNLETKLPCTKGRSVIRFLPWIIPYISIIIWVVDIILVFATKDGRRIGDHLVKTQVITVEEYQKIQQNIN